MLKQSNRIWYQLSSKPFIYLKSNSLTYEKEIIQNQNNNTELEKTVNAIFMSV